MSNFEIINGVRCRMVEPEQLQKDSKFPCAVRPINDKSKKGSYNRWTNRHLLKYIEIINSTAKMADGTPDGYMPYCDHLGGINIEVVEIIGYPEAEMVQELVETPQGGGE